MINYFPTYLALGDAFCNRTEELKRIHYDLKGNAPILLISPRRYGKTSLALKAFEKIKWPYAHVDLYKALSKEDIERFISCVIKSSLIESVKQSMKNIYKSQLTIHGRNLLIKNLWKLYSKLLNLIHTMLTSSVR